MPTIRSRTAPTPVYRHFSSLFVSSRRAWHSTTSPESVTELRAHPTIWQNRPRNPIAFEPFSNRPYFSFSRQKNPKQIAMHRGPAKRINPFVLRQEFEGYVAVEPSVFGFIHHTPPAPAQSLHDAVKCEMIWPMSALESAMVRSS